MEELLVRDLKLSMLFDAMAEDDEMLKKVCREHLLSGFSCAADALAFQRRFAQMRKNRKQTKRIFDRACETLKRIEPYKQILHPRNGVSVSILQKMDAYLQIAILTGNGLCSIYELLGETEQTQRIRRQSEELKKLSEKGGELCFCLAGDFGTGMQPDHIRLLKADPPLKLKNLFSFLKNEKNSYRCEGEAYAGLHDDVNRLRDSVYLRLIRIVAPFAQRLETQLLTFQKEYGVGFAAGRLWDYLESQGISCCFPEFSKENGRQLRADQLIDLYRAGAAYGTERFICCV